jgi:hypothetical protein
VSAAATQLAGEGGNATYASQVQRDRASRLARIAAILVFALTAALLLAVDAGPDPGIEVSRKVETTKASPSATPTQITATTEAKSPAPDRSLLARAFEGGSASLIFRILIAAGVAFLAGAFVQRVILGEYGFTIGPLSLPMLAPVSVAQAEEVVDLITESPQLSSLLAPGGLRRSHPFPQYHHIEDDRLALISIRIQIEERLRALATALGLDSDIGIARLPARLAQEGVLDPQAKEGVEKFIAVGDRIANGAVVDPAAASDLREQAGSLLYALAELRLRTQEQKEEQNG